MAYTHNDGKCRPMRYVRVVSKEDAILTGAKVQLIEDFTDRTVTRELTLHDMVREEKVGGMFYRWYAAGNQEIILTETEAGYGG